MNGLFDPDARGRDLDARLRSRQQENGSLTESAEHGLRLAGVVVENITEGVLITDPKLRILAVNLSAQEVSASPLIERIAATLAETGLDPSLLEIEITESSMMANLEAALSTLKAVKALGVTLALDDFGTGYSSLNYLRRFPIDRLKLDASFIRQIAHDETDQAIERAAIELGHGLKLGVVAEGVETRAQLEVLRGNGSDSHQGHLFAAPLPAEELGALLRSVSA